MEETGIITIEANAVDDGIEIKVIDNGVGIPANQLDKIFNTGYGKNLGIGLSNVHHRLQNLFGQNAGIQIESQLGVGTSLTFVVPERSK